MYMKWTYYSLSDNDPKAKEQIFKNLEMGAYEHTFSKKLLSRFSEASGPMLLIAFESLDLDSDLLYEHGTYQSGKGLRKVPGYDNITWMDCATWGLVSFVDKYLLKTKDAIVLCENWVATRKAVTKFPKWPRESRVLLFGDREVYHVLTSEDASNPELIESTIAESEHRWATGVCSSYTEAPQGEIPSEAFFDAIVANTSHIFTPAIDGDAYLVWSPRIPEAK